MHDHIEEMGINIVRRLHPEEPNKHSRLWIKEEIEDILFNDLGTEATRSIKLQFTCLHLDIIMKGLRKMKKLIFLYVDDGCKIDEVGQYLPKTLQANNRVHLDMVESNISQLWEGGERKALNKLRFLELNISKLRTFDLGMTPNLKTLNLAACNDFVKLHMLAECPMLESLYLNGSKVSHFNLGLTPNLKTLDLDGCNDFIELHMPIECPKLKFLNLSSSKVTNFNLGLTPHLEELNLEGCNDLVVLHMPIECSKLKFLSLNGSKVNNFNLGLTPHLEILYLEGCNDFVELHIPVECPKLNFLSLSGSKVSNLNLGMTPHLETLYLEGCNDFVELNMPVECPKLNFLSLSGSKVSNLNLRMTPYLERLYLEGCNEFVELHMPVECPKLNFLNLSGSKVSNLNLGMTPHLKRLDLSECYYLQEIHAPVGCLEKLLTCLDSTATLLVTAESVEYLICPLHPNNNLPKFRFQCNYDETLPSSSGNLEKLLSFGLCACTNLESFSASICGLQQLRVLTLQGCIPEVPKDLWQLENLERLTLWSEVTKHLPDSICMLKHLKSLDLKYCWLLEQLPKDLGRLECLEELHLMDCISLRDIPNSICNMKCLKYLLLPYCILVDKLPEELGLLECLKVLSIEGTGIRRLPQSIFKLKGLCIVGSRWQLESYGFTSLSESSTYTASYYI
ncbi:hypothetical protein L1987_01319 [Smallanthus sonchifolius]|uniref:Uncharacterized protein n=1 Tax=Smallanthus sonchifolius TaxID=185202 RepID=A0ACB9K4R8_9ASTR|nr:hypothetical protein L1987_01319 [Smallanthus sonchifolius]